MENIKNQINIHKVAEIQLSYKSNVKPSLRPKISTSRDAADILMHSWDLSRIELQEQFKVLFTNRANRVLGIFELSSGGTTGTVADPKLIFIAALRVGAHGLILAHNHPSGNLTASQMDINLTRKVKECGRLLDIQLLDHIILTVDGYFALSGALIKNKRPGMKTIL